MYINHLMTDRELIETAQYAERKMVIYIYSNEDGKQVDAIEGNDNAECEKLAGEKWGSDDYHWSYADVHVSDAV